MFEFTESIYVDRPPATVWNLLVDVEHWWPPSNPEHESIERLDDRDVVEVGARLRIREKVAGIPGVADGEITRVEPLSSITWEAAHARYRLFGITLTVGEGVTWSIEAVGTAGTNVSAHVWAAFPPGLRGDLLEWIFSYLLRGIEKDREHARIELRYLNGSSRAERTDRTDEWAPRTERGVRANRHLARVHADGPPAPDGTGVQCWRLA
jgi:uncharacterized protein YndB with AHSA1/START domain